MALKDTWIPRVDGVDDADSSAVNEIAGAVIDLEENGAGEAGATFTPSISAEGVISWGNDKGLENPEPVNIVLATIEALPKFKGGEVNIVDI